MSHVQLKPIAQEPADFDATLSLQLRPLPIPSARGAELERKMLERVRRSALAHRDFSTVRREDGVWTTTFPGLLQRALSAASGMRVDVFKVGPDVSIPWPHGVLAQEVLVVEGALAVATPGKPPIDLSPLQQIVMERDSAWRLTSGNAGATLYVRSRMVELERLAASEARWWAAAQQASAGAAEPACSWSNFVEGAEAAVLQACDDVASMLIRIAPGATLPDHGHGLDEDCFMLEGDMYLGDILMRAGDYQLARAGGFHVGILSDMGGLFYFHGAVPPLASEAAQ